MLAATAFRKRIKRIAYRFLPVDRKTLKEQRKRFERLKNSFSERKKKKIKHYLDNGYAHSRKRGHR